MAAPSPPHTPGNAGLAVSPSAQALLGQLATLWVMGSALPSVAMGQRHAGSAVGSDPWSGCWSHSWLRLEPGLSGPRASDRPVREGVGRAALWDAEAHARDGLCGRSQTAHMPQTHTCTCLRVCVAVHCSFGSRLWGFVRPEHAEASGAGARVL